jgi:spermidine synthase
MSFPMAILVAGLSGFIALSYEILWYRVFAVAFGGTAQGFALLLGFYLYGLAAGALVVERLCRRKQNWSTRRLLLALATFNLGAYVTAYLVIPFLGWGCRHSLCLTALPAVAVSTTLLGAALPLISHLAIRPDARAGAGLSQVYFANILGSTVGSLLTGYVLLDRMPASSVALVLAALGLTLSVALFWTARGSVVVFAVLGLLCFGLVRLTPSLFDGLYEKLIFKHQFRPDLRFAHTIENRVGVVNVTPAGKVFGGGVYDGWARIDLVHDPNLLVRAVAIPAFHPGPRRALVIGLSMGAWAQLIANLPTLEHLTIVEINPGYLSLIPQYPDVASLLTNPKVRVEIDDGRRWLARHPDEQFDLIVANITFHWREHATNLLSADFLRQVRTHLAPRGVYYYNATSSPDVMKTGFTVFPHGLRFGSFIAVSDTPLRLDHAAWAAAITGLTVDGRRLLNPADPVQAAAAQRLTSVISDSVGPKANWEWRNSVLKDVAGARIVTDDNMAPEWGFLAVGAWDP